MTMGSRRCVFIDLSYDGGKTRINNYIFTLNDTCFTIALTANNSTVFHRMEEFDSVFSTLKFLKN